MKLFTLLSLLFLYSQTANSQNLFDDKFEGCNTDRFTLESDSTDASIDNKVLIETILSCFTDKDRGKLNGTLTLQIIVDLEGKSCLISAKNETNIKSKKINLKEIIDSKLIWQPHSEKVGAIVQMKFDNQNVEMSRLGLDGKRGWHQLIIK